MKDFLLLQLRKINEQKNRLYKTYNDWSKTVSPFTIILLFLMGIAVIINVIFYKKTDTLKMELYALQLEKNPLPAFTPSEYPLLQTVLGINNMGIKALNTTLSNTISAHAAIIIDNDSHVVLFAKNQNLRFSMASTTKIMTALTALNYFRLDDILTIKTKPSLVEGVVVGFSQGEKVYFKDLLYAMLLPSGNDVALAISQNYPGGEKAFIEKMNENAKKWNLYNTHFADAAGLIDEGDYTTVWDLARLCSIALKNQVFVKIIGEQSKTISNVEKTNIYQLSNINKLLGTNGVYGIKTGFTKEAGGVLTTAIKKRDTKSQKEKTLITVVMKSNDRFVDTMKLITVLNNNLVYQLLGE